MPDSIAEKINERMRQNNTLYPQEFWTSARHLINDPGEDKKGRPRLSYNHTKVLPPLPEAQPLHQVRDDMLTRMRDFTATNDAQVLLVAAGAGTGKTHAGVTIAQERARAGERVLWASSRHDLFTTMRAYDHFDPSLWHHWMPSDSILSDGTPVCRFREQARELQRKGHPLMAMCRQLCTHDNHMTEGCHFRKQKNNVKPIVFGMHQHILLGMGIEYDVVIVDENPMGAFVYERTVAPDDLRVPRLNPTLQELVDVLYTLSKRQYLLSGKALMQLIESEARWALEYFGDIEGGFRIAPPLLQDANDVFRLAHEYWADLIPLLHLEMKAYDAGWEHWNPRIKISGKGVTMLDRGTIKHNMPANMIVLDATAEQDIYKFFVPDTWTINTYAPRIDAKGSINQVVGRLYGHGDMIVHENGELSEVAQQLLADVQALIRKHGYTDPAIVCHKAVYKKFARIFGSERVVYFGNLRGLNSLQRVDALFSLGTFSLPGHEIEKLAIALTGRLKPFAPLDKQGLSDPAWIHEYLPYRVKGCEQHPTRPVGVYADETLRLFQWQSTIAEIEQAIHRARPVTNPCDVWIFSSMPNTRLELDGVYEMTPISPSANITNNRGVTKTHSIPAKYWRDIEPWLLNQHENGEPVGIDDLAKIVDVATSTVRNGKWITVIRKTQADNWRYENDPIYAGGRGAKIQRLVPIE